MVSKLSNKNTSGLDEGLFVDVTFKITGGSDENFFWVCGDHQIDARKKMCVELLFKKRFYRERAWDSAIGVHNEIVCLIFGKRVFEILNGFCGKNMCPIINLDRRCSCCHAHHKKEREEKPWVKKCSKLDCHSDFLIL